MKVKIRYRQNNSYKQKTIEINDGLCLSDWHKEVITTSKVSDQCNKWVRENGGGRLIAWSEVII